MIAYTRASFAIGSNATRAASTGYERLSLDNTTRRDIVYIRSARGTTRLEESIARLRDVCERRDRLHSGILILLDDSKPENELTTRRTNAALDEAMAKFAKTRNRAQFDAERAGIVSIYYRGQRNNHIRDAC